VGRVEWNGKQAITATLSIAPGILHGGLNTLALTLPGLPGVIVEGTWLDAFSVRYARSSEPAGASVLFGATRIAPGSTPTSTLPHQIYMPLVMRNWSGMATTYVISLASPGPYRVYDVTDPDQPVRLKSFSTNGHTITFGDMDAEGSHRYHVASEEDLAYPAYRSVPPLRTLGGFSGADYVIIAPDEFAPALNSLIALRQSEGLTVTVESPQAIYDAYGDGRPDPAAVRAYLAHAYAAWEPRPTYVLLVGDGSFDPKRYRADSTPTFIPPYLADVDPWAGETAADNRYVTVDGNDDLPDMLIGRLPVQTLAEAQDVVKKIVQYETAPLPGGWNSNVTFVADNADPEAGDFAAQSEIIASTYVTTPFTAQRIYFTPPATTIASVQQAVLSAWNTGALIMQFAGHSSWQQWAQERFFHLDDLASLHNDHRWPVVVEMTCFTGAFQRPEPTLDEELLKLNDRGAVTVWGATGLGINTGHDWLDNGFFRAVFNDTVGTVGEATLAGKLLLADSGQHLDLLDTFTLLGDPALRFDRTIVSWTNQVYLPLVSRTP
jgi:hypothetical protein